MADNTRGQRASTAAEPAGWQPGSRARLRNLVTGGGALCVAVALSHSEAHAGVCSPPTPECHLKNGQQLLASDPKRAAEELLASYKLDERTDTLALYATALQQDRRYALALETWQRIIVFRESELDAAKSAARKASSRKRAAAKAAVERAEAAMEQAGEAIVKLWPNVGRVRIRIPAGQQFLVTRDGSEVDATRDVLVNAGRDEVVFTRKDGSVERVAVEVAAGAIAKIDAPAESAKQVASKPQKIEPAKPAKPAEPEGAEHAQESDDESAGEQPAATAEPALASVRYVEEPRSRTMSRVGLGLAAGAVVALGAAGTLGYLGNRDFDRAQELGCSSDGQCPFGPAADLAERSNDRGRLAQITAIGGGALLATGAVLWLVGRKTTRRTATEVTLHVAPSSAAIAWRF